jgi:small-conductance mechanosensitive channel
MKTLKEKIIAGIVGVVVGLLSYYVVNGWYSVIPWAAISLLTGYLSKNRNRALTNGAIFGYFLFLAYIIIGYKGSTDSSNLVKFGLFTVVFSLIGAVIGLIGAYGGFLLKKKP